MQRDAFTLFCYFKLTKILKSKEASDSMTRIDLL